MGSDAANLERRRFALARMIEEPAQRARRTIMRGGPTPTFETVIIAVAVMADASAGEYAAQMGLIE
jgi:hypothetical protein